MEPGSGDETDATVKSLAMQNEKLSLECQKLRAEIQKLESPRGWSEKLSEHSTLVSMLLAILGFLFAFFQYGEQQKANRKAEEGQFEQERRLRDREFMKPLWEKQLATYFEASEAAATIATTSDPNERARAENKFWMLYEGPLIIIESPAVAVAMKTFGSALSAQTNQSPKPTKDLRDLSRELASAFQESLIEGANLRLDEFRKGKFDYRR